LHYRLFVLARYYFLVRKRQRTVSRPAWLDPYREPAARLIGEAVSSTFALGPIGSIDGQHRETGSAAHPALDRGDSMGGSAEMNKDGLENVHTERVMVPQVGARHREARENCGGRRATRFVMLGLWRTASATNRGTAIQAEVIVGPYLR